MTHLLFQKLVLSTVVFFVVLVTALYGFGELVVYFEMWSTGVKERVELAEDFGLGVLFVIVVMPVSFVLASMSGWIAWRRFSRLGQTNSRTT